MIDPTIAPGDLLGRVLKNIHQGVREFMWSTNYPYNSIEITDIRIEHVGVSITVPHIVVDRGESDPRKESSILRESTSSH